MSSRQMQERLQGHHGMPVVLKKEGAAAVKCPCCGNLHEHEPGSGHCVAGCDDNARCSTVISVGARSLVPDFGHDICKHKEGDNANALPMPQDQIMPDCRCRLRKRKVVLKSRLIASERHIERVLKGVAFRGSRNGQLANPSMHLFSGEGMKKPKKTKGGGGGKILPQSRWTNLLHAFCDCMWVTLEQVWVQFNQLFN